MRSLSAMIQSMRKDEEDRLDEEADIMRELEMEDDGISATAKPRAPQIQVADSQVEMPLGPDRGSESEEEEEEDEVGPDGKPRRVWKKKGLKRQTRRTNSGFSMFKYEITYTNAPQCDQILSSPNPSQNFDTTRTQMPGQILYQRHRDRQMQCLHCQTPRMILTMQAMYLTQRRSASRQRIKQRSRLKRKRVWLRK